MSGRAAAIVTLRGVSRDYPGGVAALRDVDLDIDRGEMVAIVGPSGSGKSTLLNVLGTLDRPTTGEVVIDGFDVAGLSDRELSALRAHRIGFVFQQFHLAPGVPALDNVADGLLYTGANLRQRRERAARALERVGLGTPVDPPATRAVRRGAAAHRHRPRGRGRTTLLLADEPTGALDSHAGESLMRLLTELHESGTTIVVITHERQVAAYLPRQVSMLDGQVVGDRTAVAT